MTDGRKDSDYQRLTNLEAALIGIARERWDQWRKQPEWQSPPDTDDLYAEIRRIRCVREHGTDNLHRKDKAWARKEKAMTK